MITKDQETQFGGNENLSLKIAYGSYRMFFVPGTPSHQYCISNKANEFTETEDYFHRSRPIEQLESFEAKEAELEDSAGDIFREKFDRDSEL